MAEDRKDREDDGRTLADMSGLERPNLFLPRKPRTDRPLEQKQADRPWEETGLSKEERRWYILGAIRAALLIALCFITGLGLVILLMVLFWK